MLVGAGALMDEIKQLVTEMGLQEDVLFVGQKSNVADYYQAMDYFLFPSFFEGLPGTVVEAQSAVLKCLISDTITTEVDVTDLVSRMSIEDEPKKWSDKILSDVAQRMDRQQETSRYEEEISEAGFDAAVQAERMAYFYEHRCFK
jgi:glycosyltransferase involved in cell wall biosynthesis